MDAGSSGRHARGHHDRQRSRDGKVVPCHGGRRHELVCLHNVTFDGVQLSQVTIAGAISEASVVVRCTGVVDSVVDSSREGSCVLRVLSADCVVVEWEKRPTQVLA